MATRPSPPTTRWNPWSALATRSDITFCLDPIADVFGGGFYARRGDQRAIVLAPALGRRRRRTALAHELIHDERGCPPVRTDDCPAALDVLAEREEHAVDAEVARRLVPAVELAALVAERASLGEAILAWEVAEEFDVDDTTASRAMAALRAAQS